MDRRREVCRGGGHLEKRKKGNNKYKYIKTENAWWRAESLLRAKARTEEWWYIQKPVGRGRRRKMTMAGIWKYSQGWRRRGNVTNVSPSGTVWQCDCWVSGIKWPSECVSIYSLFIHPLTTSTLPVTIPGCVLSLSLLPPGILIDLSMLQLGLSISPSSLNH